MLYLALPRLLMPIVEDDKPFLKLRTAQNRRALQDLVLLQIAPDTASIVLNVFLLSVFIRRGRFPLGIG